MLRAVGAVEGVERLRLSSIEVDHLDARVVAALAETTAALPHLHVPMQSGDDGVLRAMRRGRPPPATPSGSPRRARRSPA